MAENVTLTRNQRRALAAILASKTLSEAAQTAGLSEKTLYRYLENNLFRQAVNQAEKETIDLAGRRLLAGQEKALDTLTEVMDNAPKESDRRQAAASWMDFVLRWRELRNIEQRIAELESKILGG